MASHPRTPRPRGDRRGRQLRPCVLPLEPRVVPSLTFPGIAGITFDTSGDIFVSYNSTTRSSGQQQSVAEVGSNGYLANASVFSTTGASAFPGALTTVGSSASLPIHRIRTTSSSSSPTANSSSSTRSAERPPSTTICRTTPRMRRTSSTCRRAPRSISAARSVSRVRRTANSAFTTIRWWSPPSRTTGTS